MGLNTQKYITLSDKLFNRGNINSDIVTISKDSVAFGSQLLQVANIIYGPFTTTSPDDKYWGVDASLSYNGAAVMSLTAAIIYHGDTPIALHTNSYIQPLAVTGALSDATTGYPTQKNCDGLSPLTLDCAGIEFNIPFDVYRWPGSENATLGGNPSKCYLAVQDLRTPYGSGLEYSLGLTTFEVLDSLSRYNKLPGRNFNNCNENLVFAVSGQASGNTFCRINITVAGG